ncbi:MAG: hypothetical protein WC242_02665 [Candidatus Paceibacterota bacterium]|jgi:hypothetical protein
MKIAKKIFGISFVSFLLFFAVNVLAIDPPTGLNINHSGTPPNVAVIIEWDDESAEYYKVYANGVQIGDDFYNPTPHHVFVYTESSSGDYVYGVESFDPVTGDVSSRLEQSYTVPVVDPPTNLSLNQDADNRVDVSWNGTSQQYRVYRDGNLVNTTTAGNTNFQDVNVPTGNHLYKVTSYNATINAESTPISASIDVTGPGSFVEDCDNTMEDDGDGKIDCEDPDCSADPACVPPPIEICTGGVDEDNDGLVDCADDNCLGDPACTGGGTHRPSGDLFPIIQCGYNCPGVFPGDPGADCCTLCDAFETISRIINIILMFGFILGGMFLVVAGIIMYAGGASSGLLNKSKTIIKGVIFGLVIMLVSYLIVFTIIHFLSAGNADTLFSIKNGGFVIECTP